MSTTKICLGRTEAISFLSLGSTSAAVAALVKNVTVTPEFAERVRAASRLHGEVKLDYRMSPQVEAILGEIKKGAPADAPAASISGLVRVCLPAQVAPVVVVPARRGWKVWAGVALGIAVLVGWGLERSRADLAAKEAAWAAEREHLLEGVSEIELAKAVWGWGLADPERKASMLQYLEKKGLKPQG